MLCLLSLPPPLPLSVRAHFAWVLNALWAFCPVRVEKRMRVLQCENERERISLKMGWDIVFVLHGSRQLSRFRCRPRHPPTSIPTPLLPLRERMDTVLIVSPSLFLDFNFTYSICHIRFIDKLLITHRTHTHSHAHAHAHTHSHAHLPQPHYGWRHCLLAGHP